MGKPYWMKVAADSTGAYHSLASARSSLLALAEQTAADVGDEELLEGLIFRLAETVGSNVSSAQGWQQLEQALRFAFNAGA